MNPITFKANYKNSVEIQKYNGKEYKPCTVAFVELEPSESEVIKNVHAKWNAPLVSGIYKAYSQNPNSKHVYAITTQNNSFKYLDSNKILGIALLEEYRNTPTLTPEITYFQVNPQNLSKEYGNSKLNKLKKYFKKLLHCNKSPKQKPQYQHIGTKLMKSIQKLYNEKKIILFPLPEAESFYKKMGFKKSGLFMVWNSK